MSSRVGRVSTHEEELLVRAHLNRGGRDALRGVGHRPGQRGVLGGGAQVLGVGRGGYRHALRGERHCAGS